MNISAELIAIGILGVALVTLGVALASLGWKVSSDIRHELKQEIHYVREDVAHVREDVADVRGVVADVRERMARLEGLFEGFHQGRIDRGKEVTGAPPPPPLTAGLSADAASAALLEAPGLAPGGSMIQNSCPPNPTQALFFQPGFIVIH